MSNTNYIAELLDLKDPNFIFVKVTEEQIKDFICKVIYATLQNKPDICPHCGKSHLNIHGYKLCTIKIMPISGYNAVLKLNKQRYICKDCKKTFTAKTDFVDKNCYISNPVKNAAAMQSTQKISEKDIAKQLNISHNTVNRIINSSFTQHKVNTKYLPEAMCFDEFKSTKDAAGAMSFIYCDAETHEIIDIVENRQLHNLRSYFSRFPKKVRNKVKYIVIDMYKPYESLIKELFPKARIVTDKFHVINNLARALNKTRITLMKREPRLYNKLKRYYKLLPADRSKLDGVHFRRYRCFNKFMSQTGIVDYLLEQDERLKNTYTLYQQLLSALKRKDTAAFKGIIHGEYKNISGYFKTALKTCRQYEEYIINSMMCNYTNGVIEGINNKIKVVKRIAFGYRSFYHFRNRILIMCKMVHIEKQSA